MMDFFWGETMELEVSIQTPKMHTKMKTTTVAVDEQEPPEGLLEPRDFPTAIVDCGIGGERESENSSKDG